MRRIALVTLVACDHARTTASGVTFREELRREPHGTVTVVRGLEGLYGNHRDLLRPAT
ncbi:hypothetical protein ACPCJU_07490 [Streptomyces thermodiastaticus]|jgi:hypothetical protein|uniref:hypothetical protein n=1 Tax=Streptomyces thermoviolaceus TaxID=1952 RepID=UPI0038709214